MADTNITDKKVKHTAYPLAKFNRACAWSLLVLITIYFISGFGITKAGMISAASIGLIHKITSFRLHTYLVLPLAFAFLCHTLISIRFAMIRWNVKNKILLNYVTASMGILLFALVVYAYLS
ncbi:MAG: hypothetical protein V1729_04570 [Candidatus Woesearchaeota archaeon]